MDSANPQLIDFPDSAAIYLFKGIELSLDVLVCMMNSLIISVVGVGDFIQIGCDCLVYIFPIFTAKFEVAGVDPGGNFLRPRFYDTDSSGVANVAVKVSREKACENVHLWYLTGLVVFVDGRVCMDYISSAYKYPDLQRLQYCTQACAYDRVACLSLYG